MDYFKVLEFFDNELYFWEFLKFISNSLWFIFSKLLQCIIYNFAIEIQIIAISDKDPQ